MVRQMIDVMFLGHLGRDALAAAAVGITYYQMVLFFVFGMCTALDTYASQAYGQNDEGVRMAVCCICLCSAADCGLVWFIAAAMRLLRPSDGCRSNRVLDGGGVRGDDDSDVPDGGDSVLCAGRNCRHLQPA